MTTTPLVSVCVPTYNGAQYIEEAIHSILDQSYPNLEIIISDDNSSDDTLDIVRTVLKTTDIPNFIYKHTPKGIGANWNNCVKKTQGTYIKFLFQDDVLLPHCIASMVALLETDKTIGMVYSRRNFLFDTDKEQYATWLKKYSVLHKSWKTLNVQTGVLEGKTYLKDDKLLDPPGNKIGEPSAVILRKEVFKKVGWFNTELKQKLDFEYWYRLMPFYNIGFIDEPLVKFRLHQNQASMTNQSKDIKDAILLPQIFIRKLFFHLSMKSKKKLLKTLFNSL